MAYRRVGLAAPLLGVNLVLYIILLGLSSWAIDDAIDGQLTGGNGATGELIHFSLIAGVVGIASVIVGLAYHVRYHRAETHGGGRGAASSAVIALLVTGLAFGLACKQINAGYVHSDRLKALEVFAIIVTATQLLYVIIIYGYVE